MENMEILMKGKIAYIQNSIEELLSIHFQEGCNGISTDFKELNGVTHEKYKSEHCSSFFISVVNEIRN